jgi:cellulose synthase/poly-beta-1,6-N-acetylglucosamine synthase-like glycosyltransferase
MTALLFWVCAGVTCYVYFGYPILLWLLAAIFGKRRNSQRITPSVTLLIAAYNEQGTISAKLENSLALDYPAGELQILVAADGSTDETVEIVRRFAGRGVQLSYSPQRQGKMAAINHAMSLATGEIVVFSDANNAFTPSTLRELVMPFDDAGIGVVSGAKSIVSGDGGLGDSEGLYWRYESFIKVRESRLGCCVAACGEILAIRRQLFESPPEDIINDDGYIALRLIRSGSRMAYAPLARSYERISASASDEIARRTRIFAGRFQMLTLAPKLIPINRPLVLWQEISHQYLRALLPLAMLGALIASFFSVMAPASARWGILGLAQPANWIMLSAQLAFYAMAWVGTRVEHNGSIFKLLYLPTFLVNSNLAGLIGIYQFLTRKQTVLWQRAERQDMERVFQTGHNSSVEYDKVA